LERTRQGRRRLAFVKAITRDDLMLKVARQCLERGLVALPIVERLLHCRYDVAGIGAPGQIMADHYKASVTSTP
jgi:hypothetical protein